jgi:hypothetical protein
MTPLPPEVANTIPPKWLVYATAAWLLLQNAGRVYQAIRNGGGLVGVWRGVMYGSNVPVKLVEQVAVNSAMLNSTGDGQLKS